MKPIAIDVVIPNPGFIGMRDLLSANDRKRMTRWLSRFQNDMPRDMGR